MELYCELCCLPFEGRRCPVCGRKAVRGVEPEDLCFLTEQEQIWAGMLADVLQKEGIPCLRKSVLGAGLALKGGVMMERERFYVYFRQLDAAREIVEGLFAVPDEEADAAAWTEPEIEGGAGIVKNEE